MKIYERKQPYFLKYFSYFDIVSIGIIMSIEVKYSTMSRHNGPELTAGS